MLFEGAQGHLLDIDFGTYPYVTASHPIAAGAIIGAGVGPTKVSRVVGVVKAYTSRVGEGPFPTELHGEEGDRIREEGHEYGTTTGRPRRIGWLDLVMVRYACRVSGITDLAVPHLDTLAKTGLPTLKVCVGYRMPDGTVTREFPVGLKALSQVEPVYEELPNWEWSEAIEHRQAVRGSAGRRPAVRQADRGGHRRSGLHPGRGQRTDARRSTAPASFEPPDLRDTTAGRLAAVPRFSSRIRLAFSLRRRYNNRCRGTAGVVQW